MPTDPMIVDLAVELAVHVQHLAQKLVVRGHCELAAAELRPEHHHQEVGGGVVGPMRHQSVTAQSQHSHSTVCKWVAAS